MAERSRYNNTDKANNSIIVKDNKGEWIENKDDNIDNIINKNKDKDN